MGVGKTAVSQQLKSDLSNSVFLDGDWCWDANPFQVTNEAKAAGISNCPLCAIGHDANKQKIWKLTEMDADHVKAWSKGGATDESNCQLLCKTHNRAKGNK